jgi:DNA-binding beta-propeller fold protein YncE
MGRIGGVFRSRPRRELWVLAGAFVAVALVAGAVGGALGFKLDDYSLPADDPVQAETISGVRRLPDGAYSYVVSDGVIRIYDIGRGHALVKKIELPDRYDVNGVRGVAADAASHRLYVSFWGADPTDAMGHLIAYDLLAGKVLWKRSYEPSIDSMALTPDGRKLYMPCGEERGDCDHWFVLDASNGDELERIPMHEGTHNTIAGLGGRRAYLASKLHNRLAVVDTRTDRIIRWVGPFGNSIRPFTVSRDERFVFVTVTLLSGFEIGDLRTGRKLFRVPVRGFPLRPEDHPALPITQSHGIALTPDETEIWVVDSFYRHLHVFDVTGLPEQAPRQIADIQLTDDPKWINFTRDGRYAHVSTGEIVDARTRRVVALTESSRYFLQVDWKAGKPIRAYSRYGLGYGS